MYTFNFFKEFGASFHNLVALTPNVRPPPRNSSSLFARVSASRIIRAPRLWRRKTLCKFPMEHADHTLEAYRIALPWRCKTLSSVPKEEITYSYSARQFVDRAYYRFPQYGHQKRVSIVTPKSFCELTCGYSFFSRSIYR